MRPHFPLASGRRAKLLAEARDEQPEEVARLERLYEMQEAAKDFAAVIYAASAKHEDLEGIAPTDPSDAEASTRATRDRLRASAARYRQQAQRVRLAQAAWERLAHALDEFNTQHPDEMNATSESTRQAWEKMAADNDLLPLARVLDPQFPGFLESIAALAEELAEKEDAAYRAERAARPRRESVEVAAPEPEDRSCSEPGCTRERRLIVEGRAFCKRHAHELGVMPRGQIGKET